MKRTVIAVIVVLTFWLALFLKLSVSIFGGMTDFSVLYCSGRMVAAGDGSQIYNYEAQRLAQLPFAAPGTIVLPYVFPPYILLLFVPFSLLPYKAAVVLWYALNSALLVSIPLLLRKALVLTDWQLSLSILALAFFYPATACLSMGQVSILTLLFFTLSFLSLESGHEVLAGCLLALAIYKPQFVIVPILIFIVKRNWQVIQGFLATSAGLFGISVLVSGWKTTLALPAAIRAIHGRSGTEYPDKMPNLRGVAASVISSETRVLMLAVIASVVLVFALLFLLRKTPVGPLWFSLVIILSLLASYHSGKHDLVLLVLPLLVLSQVIIEIESPHLAATLALLAGALFLSPAMFPGPASAVVMLLLLGFLWRLPDTFILPQSASDSS